MNTQIRLTTLAALALLCAQVGAAPADYTITQVAANFIEATPTREKVLTPPMALSSGELVETHVVVSFKNRLIVNSGYSRTSGKVAAVGILRDKSRMQLGSADVVVNSSRISDDRRRGLFSMQINRLADKPLLGVTFEGKVPVTVAQSTRKVTLPFQTKVGFKLNSPVGEMAVSRIEPSVLVLDGNYSLAGLQGITLIMPNGTRSVGELGGYSSGTTVKGISTNSQWKFGQPIQQASKVELNLYEGVETIELPLSLVVMRPF